MKLLAIALLAAAAVPLQDGKGAEDLFKESLAKAKDSKRKLFLTFGSPG